MRDVEPVLDAYCRWATRYSRRDKGKFIRQWAFKVWTFRSIPSDELKVWEALRERWTQYSGLGPGSGVHYVTFDKETYLPYMTGFSPAKIGWLLKALTEKGLLRWTRGEDTGLLSNWTITYALFHDTRHCVIWMLKEKDMPTIEYAGYHVPDSLLPRVDPSSTPNNIKTVEGLPPTTASSRTHHGYVYLISNKEEHYKIGRAKDPVSRIRRLEVVLPYDIEVIHLIECENYISAEGELHAIYAKQRVRGEWFRLSPEQVEEIKQIKEM